MEHVQPVRVHTISELHRLLGFATPQHPLISVIDYAQMEAPEGVSAVFDFYSISLKRGANNLLYGQQKYDFDCGAMSFLAPNQVLQAQENIPDTQRSGWIMFVHADFLWNTPLAKKIRQLEFFDYSVNEALFVSEKEESLINQIVKNIAQEYQANIDKFSQDVIVAQLELMLTYAQRFYERQFITRKISGSKILSRFEDILTDYFNSENILAEGLPTVQYISGALNISAKYLGSLLKQLTGLTTQQHIHSKLIEKAKEKLTTTSLSVSEIAYGLGFEHSQSFSKLFRSKTSQSPLEFRQAFGNNN